MMTQRMWQICYSGIACPMLWVGAHLFAYKNQNLKESLEGRKGLWQRLNHQLMQRDPKKPLIWFHVSSAGEFLQAQPVLERFTQQGFECAVTYTSVNAYKWIQRSKLSPDQRPVVLEYLPIDSARNMRRLLKLLEPAVIVYVKFDLWPNLIWEAHAAGIPQYQISATLQPNSKRLTTTIGRSMYRTLYACFNGIFAVTEDDRQRFLSTNPEHRNIRTVGDTRFDSVLDRKKKLPPTKLPSYISDKFVLIIGSSWPADETVIFPALKEALKQYPDLILIIAPHEPSEAHLRNSEIFFKDFSIKRFTKLQQEPAQPPRVILIDTVGILSSIYSVGALAYIGGGFSTGVHNVIEPCAMGLPVIFGPINENSPEALDLLKQKMVFTVNNGEDFHALLFRFLEEPELCVQLGQKATQRIEAQAGVADRCFQLISSRLNLTG